MKSSVKENWFDLCSDIENLNNHIHQLLENRNPQYFVFDHVKSMPAAVLIPLFFKQGQAHLLFTKRTTKVAHHKGQISFPGGRKDSSDSSLLYTALRETEEEVGINAKDVNILGQTDNMLTNTHFMVSPFVGSFKYPYKLEPNPDEIERIIEVPLLHLLDDNNFRIQNVTKNGTRWSIHYYYYNDDIIWGVTGFLLSNFLSLIFGIKRKIPETLSRILP